MLRLLDLGVNVDFPHDLQEHRRLRVDGRDDAAGGFGVRGAKDGDAGVGGGGGFAAEGADRGEFGGTGGMGVRGRELDVNGRVFFDGILGRDGPYGFADGEQELVRFLRRRVVVLGVVGRVCRYDDRGRFVTWAAWETLPELFGEEGHEGMNHGEAAFEGGVESVPCRPLFLRGAVGNDGFGVLNVGVAEVGVPVLVGDVCCRREFAVGESGVYITGGDGEFVEDPAVSEGGVGGAFVSVGDGDRFEGGRKLAEDVFGGLVNFVAKATVAMHHLNVEVDVAA